MRVRTSISLLVLLTAGQAIAAQTAREVADLADKRHRVPYEHTHARMTLQEKDGVSRERTVEGWYANDDKNGDKLKIRFQTPADVQGTGLLSIEVLSAGESDDEQWLYLPSFKKTRRIAQAELGDRFVGTDLFYEDMKRRRLDDYTYTFLPEESVEGQPCFVIEALPSSPKVIKQSPYGRTMLWARKDNFFIVRVRVFDKDGGFAELSRINTKDLPGREFWVGGEIARKMPPAERARLEKEGVQIFENAQALLLKIGPAALEGT